MQEYKRDFIELALERDVLRFGEFTLKSGRKSPYFFNAGLFNSGAALAALGRFYAHAIIEAELEFDTLFGPAYKGISLVSATAIALAEHHGTDVPYCFNRKEAKDHGEGGHLIGAPLIGRVLIIDDVITAGTAIRESIDLIRGAGAVPAGVVIALDRQEKGTGDRSAVDEVRATLGLTVTAIIQLTDLVDYLGSRADLGAVLVGIERYRKQYGTG